jgi:hypothetical protein
MKAWISSVAVGPAEIYSPANAIEIYGIKVTHETTKKPLFIPIPKTESEYSAGSEKLFLDLLKVDEAMTITGYIDQDSCTSLSSDIWNIHDALYDYVDKTANVYVAITNNDGVVRRIEWATTGKCGILTRLAFDVVPTDEDTPTAMQVTLEVMRGKNAYDY